MDLIFVKIPKTSFLSHFGLLTRGTFFQKLGFVTCLNYTTLCKKSEKTEQPVLRSCTVNGRTDGPKVLSNGQGMLSNVSHFQKLVESNKSC